MRVCQHGAASREELAERVAASRLGVTSARCVPPLIAATISVIFAPAMSDTTTAFRRPCFLKRTWPSFVGSNEQRRSPRVYLRKAVLRHAPANGRGRTRLGCVQPLDGATFGGPRRRSRIDEPGSWVAPLSSGVALTRQIADVEKGHGPRQPRHAAPRCVLMCETERRSLRFASPAPARHRFHLDHPLLQPY